jgi:hypothetical protein
MLVHEKLQETNETDTTDTTAVELPTPAGSEPPDPTRSPRRPWRRVTALAATGAVVGIATLAVITPSSGGELAPAGGSSVVEANRLEVLRGLASGRVSDGSFEVAELNRMEVLRDLATTP